MNPLKGKLIVVEGLEGAGKSTVIREIQHILSPLVSHIVLTREPGGTMLGEAVRSLVKTTSLDDLDPEAELLLFYAARLQLLSQVIYPALQQGHWVIADRFELSSFAYQGGGRGIALTKIAELSHLFLKGFKPDFTIFLDIPPNQGLTRAQSRGEIDRIEQESLDFFERVQKTYRDMISDQKNLSVAVKPSIVIIDASQDLEHVKKDLWYGVQTWLQDERVF